MITRTATRIDSKINSETETRSEIWKNEEIWTNENEKFSEDVDFELKNYVPYYDTFDLDSELLFLNDFLLFSEDFLI